MISINDYEELAGNKVRIGEFILEELISLSGQAVIFRVKSLTYRKELALKVFGLTSSADPRSIKAAFKEIEASILDHKSVIRYFPAGQEKFDFKGEERTVVFIPMDYTPLGSCEKKSPFRNKNGDLSETDYKAIIRLLDGLDEIHSKGIIHEDIKPANILKFSDREDDEDIIRLVITDFGISKMNSAFGTSVDGESGATLPYMSPEQLDKKHSYKGDIYSMGATLFYLITDVDPIVIQGFQRDIPLVWQEAHKTRLRPNPRDYAKECHPRLALLIMRMMSILPKDRPDVEECKAEIKKIIEIEKDNKFNNHKASPELEETLKSNSLPIYYTSSFTGVFKPEVHTHSKNSYFVFQIEMRHPVYIQYRTLIEKLVSYFSDTFSLYETWGRTDTVVLVWSKPETVEKFKRVFEATFYGSKLNILSASKIHHFPAQEFASLNNPRLVYALAIQENKKIQGLTDDIEKEYIYRYFSTDVPENSVRAFTFVDAVDQDDAEKYRVPIVANVKDIMEQLTKKLDTIDSKRSIRKARVIEFSKDQSKICLIDFVAKNYRFLVDVPTQIIEEFGENAVKTTTFLETRRVVFQSDKILF
jgi:serine/threonine protein kinase